MGESSYDLNFPFAFGGPLTRADFRVAPEDFIVDEVLGFEPSGEGEHIYLQITKRGENTGWVAEQLAKMFAVRPVDVGFCGLKDRHACTSQWFSVHLPKPTGDEADILAELEQRIEGNIVLTQALRHSKKLRRGGHQANHFRIRLRNLTGKEGLEERLQQIARQGVPNYFGEQRFGNYASNLMWAERWMTAGEKIRSRNKRIMAQSAARSWLFNQVLAARVSDNSWSERRFGEATPSGPLWGRGRPVVGLEQAAFEQRVIEPWSGWLDVLEHVGLNQERRNLVLFPQGMSWSLDEGLEISFALPPGGYATAVLRELSLLDNQSMPEAEQ